MADSEFGFRQLIAPVGADCFRDTYWENTSLLVKREHPEYYSMLFDMGSIDAFLSTLSPHSPNVLIAKDGKDIPLGQIVPKDLTSLSLECVLTEYSHGATLIFPQIQDSWPPLKSLCRRLSTECSARFQINSYLTPRGSQGFDVHYDTHDVFIAQISGRKRWTIYKSPNRLPLPDQPFVGLPEDELEISDDIELEAGDLLYLPRGVMHKAISLDEASLHLTIGMVPISWADVLVTLVLSTIGHDPAFRRSLPLGFARHHGRQPEIQAELRALMHRLVERADCESAVEDARSAARLTPPVAVEGRLLDLEAVETISSTTPLCVRSHMDWSIEDDRKEVCLRFLGKEVQIPRHAKNAIDFMKDLDGSFSVAQLPRGLSVEGGIVLVKRLVREGLLTIASPSAQNLDRQPSAQLIA